MTTLPKPCARCGKPMARLNPGPWCYACQKGGHGAQPAPRARRQRRTIDPETAALAYELSDAGVAQTEISRRTGVPRSTLYALMRRRALEEDQGADAPGVAADDAA